MAKRLAALLRRWADRLDPPCIAVVVESPAFPPPAPTALVESVPNRQDRFVVVAEEKRTLYDGPRGGEASRRFLNEKRNNIPVVLWHSGEKRDWWPR